ncbi:MAG: HAMP domain-containing sensor histidine kinase [Armatimonadota bacterium]
MPIVPKASTRIHLAVAILLTIVLSWILSSGISNYLNYLNFRSFHQQMVAHPDIYPKPIPEPKFGIVEFLTGRPPFPRNHSNHELQQDQRQEPNHPIDGASGQRPQPQRPDRGPDWPSRAQFEVRSLILRLVIALGLAVLAGAWLGRRFTRPLTQLADGAEAFQSGNFSYRIPTKGNNEFTEVAAAMNVMAQQVSDQISHLEEDAERRRQFLADIAHELRSPVTTMRTMAGALQDGLADKPERRERAVTALVGTSERLLRLVQDLMELAKLDLEDFPLNIRQADLRELIESVIRSYDDEAAAAGIVLHPLEGTSSVTASVDPDRITQVLNNIVENAISYAGKGAELKIRLEDKNPIKITISDTGKGIKAEDMPYVSDPFYRADAARTPGDCHSGLGLSIACRLVEAHGGQFNISSKEGKGTTATISIPK